MDLYLICSRRFPAGAAATCRRFHWLGRLPAGAVRHRCQSLGRATLGGLAGALRVPFMALMVVVGSGAALIYATPWVVKGLGQFNNYALAPVLLVVLVLIGVVADRRVDSIYKGPCKGHCLAQNLDGCVISVGMFEVKSQSQGYSVLALTKKPPFSRRFRLHFCKHQHIERPDQPINPPSRTSNPTPHAPAAHRGARIW